MEKTDTSFIDVKVRINNVILREYVFGKHGFVRDAVSVGCGVLLCIVASGLQLAWPSACPELPIYPVVLVCCHLFDRHGKTAVFWPLLCGVFIDAALFRRMGCTSLILIISSVVFAWIRGCQRLRPLLSLSLACGSATFIWSFTMLLFCADGMDIYQRIAMIPRELLFAPALSILLGFIFFRHYSAN